MDTVLTILGVAVVAVGLNDIFHTLLHPGGRGRVSHWIAVGVWRISRMFGISLAASAPYAIALSAKAQHSADKDIQLNGRILQTALDDLAQHIKKQFTIPGNSTAEIFSSFMRDHRHAAQQDH